MNEKKLWKFTDIGEGLHEGVIQEVKAKIGDLVEEGQSLLSVQTDKVASDLPAPMSGTVLKIYVKEGQTVHVGEPMMYIGDQDEKIDDTPIKQSQPVTPVATQQNVQQKIEEEVVDANEGASVVGKVTVSNKLMAMLGDQANQSDSLIKSHENIATPLARKTANDLRINLSQINGSGPNGRIVYDDVLLFQRNRLASEVNNFLKNEEKQKAIAINVNPEDATHAVTRMRKEISASMTRSHINIPDTTLFFDLDVTQLVQLRDKIKYDFKSKNNVNLTYLAFFVQALALTLKKFPVFNAVYDSIHEELVHRGNVNIGIAVDTVDGLIVPNIKNANELSIASIAQEIARLAKAAKDKKLTLKEIQNGTFTISNLGSTGAIYGTPIIFFPEVAIFGLGKIEEKLYLDENKNVQTKQVMYFSVTVDHRWIDGADVGRFANYLKELFDAKFYERELNNVY